MRWKALGLITYTAVCRLSLRDCVQGSLVLQAPGSRDPEAETERQARARGSNIVWYRYRGAGVYVSRRRRHCLDLDVRR